MQKSWWFDLSFIHKHHKDLFVIFQHFDLSVICFLVSSIVRISFKCVKLFILHSSYLELVHYIWHLQWRYIQCVTLHHTFLPGGKTPRQPALQLPHLCLPCHCFVSESLTPCLLPPFSVGHGSRRQFVEWPALLHRQFS